MAFTNNYSTSFRWWDWLFGTDDKYREYKARLQEAKSKLKNATKEEELMVERRLLAEIEAEGLRAEAEVEARAEGKIKAH